MAAKKTNNKSNIIILTSLGIFIILFIIAIVLSQHVTMNKGNVTGNTAGNLNNGGLFCELDGVVYFSNAYDSGCLYSMNADETNMKKLSEIKASSINTDGSHLYYYLDSSKKGVGLGYMQRTYGIYRSNMKGKKVKCLVRGNAITMQLSGNYLYYQFFDNNSKKGTQLYKVKIDNSEESRVADYNINPASCVDGIIYFNGTKDNHYLYTLNTQMKDAITLLWEGNVWNPIYDNSYIYYMDVSSDYRLCRYSLTMDTVEVLTEDRVDFYNLYGNYIYYQKNSETEPSLNRMYTDGSSPEVVASGIYNNINITSNYVYFAEFNSDVPVYKTPVNDPVNVTLFDAAANAVIN